MLDLQWHRDRGRERQRETERQRDTERDRERQRQRERKTERERGNHLIEEKIRHGKVSSFFLDFFSFSL